MERCLMSWVDAERFDHVYLWLWNTTGELADDLYTLIGPIQPLPNVGSRIVIRPDIRAFWSAEALGVYLTGIRGVIATTPAGAVLWFTGFAPVAVRDGSFHVALPPDFWESSYDLRHVRVPDAKGLFGPRAEEALQPKEDQ
jgi:hypothetical protein